MTLVPPRTPTAPAMLTFDGFVLDERLYELRRSGERVPVQPKVLDVLAYLVRHRDRVVAKGELLEAFWPDVDVGETALTQAIKGVRRALDDDGDGQRYVATVRGRGYRFVARVEERPGVTEAPASPSSPSPGCAAPGRQVFVGREGALTLLSRKLDEAIDGTSKVVVVLGEPGIGKSRLAEEVAQLARSRGALALAGFCPADDHVPGYWPWVQLVRGYAADAGDDAVIDALGTFAGDVAKLVPDVADLAKLHPGPRSLADADDRFRTFDGFVRFLRRASSRRPLLLTLEDLHWADDDSLALFRFVARELRAARILIVATCRDTVLARESSTASRAVTELLRDDPERRVFLDGLAPRDVGAFVEATTGRLAPPELIATLVGKTAGNPLYLGQLLRGGDVEERLAALSSEASAGELADGLRECVERHLAALSPACRRLLAMAAVLGAVARLTTLRAALGASQEELLELLDEATRGRVLEGSAPGSLTFAHEVLRDALLHGLRAAERARLHATAAEALSAEYAARPEPRLAELAHHYRLAIPVLGSAPAIDHLARAARYAAATAAVDQAVRSFDLALETLAASTPQDTLRLDLLLGLGDALRKTEDHARAHRVFREAAELARALSDGERLAQAALGYAFEPESGEVDEARVALLESALAFRPACRPPVRARLLARLGEALYFSEIPERRARHGALAREAIGIARELGDPGTLLLSLRSLQYAYWGTSATKERLLASREMLRIAETTGDPEHLAIALFQRMGDVLDLGDVRAFDEGLALFERASDELRLPLYRFYVTMLRASRALLAGRLDAAERSFGEALAAGRPEPLMHLYLGAQLFALRRDQGRLAELEPSVRALAAQFPEIAPWRCGLGLIACAEGRLDEAREVLEHFVAGEVRAMRDDGNRPVCLAVLSTVCAALDDRARAGVLYDALAPLDGMGITVGHGIVYWAPASQALGVLASIRGEADRAVSHLEQAVAATERMGAKVLLARAQADLAAALRKRGKRGDAERAEGLSAGRTV